jgi:hypothetical protein
MLPTGSRPLRSFGNPASLSSNCSSLTKTELSRQTPSKPLNFTPFCHAPNIFDPSHSGNYHSASCLFHKPSPHGCRRHWWSPPRRRKDRVIDTHLLGFRSKVLSVMSADCNLLFQRCLHPPRERKRGNVYKGTGARQVCRFRY